MLADSWTCKSKPKQVGKDGIRSVDDIVIVVIMIATVVIAVTVIVVIVVIVIVIAKMALDLSMLS